MYNRIFESMYTGSMVGSGPLMFAVWPYVIAHIRASDWSGLEGMRHSAKSARKFIARARSNRVIRLSGAGNAIVPQVAAEFIRAFMEIKKDGE